MASITKEQFRAAMGSFAAGVTVVTTMDAEGVPWGLTATAFSSLSLEPPLCLVCIGNRAASLPVVLARRAFVVNMLRSTQVEVSQRFASPIPDKFAGIAWRPGEVTGCPCFDDALASIECDVVAVHEGGDHQIVVGELRSVVVHEGEPLAYFRGGYADVVSKKKA